MNKIIAFAGSSSRNSINKKLVTYVSSLFEKVEVEILDLNDYELPLYSIDREKEFGKPELVTKFLQKISEADLIILSLAEHNGNFSAAFKNIFDWSSRWGIKVFQQKPLLLMATSNGARGGKSVLEIAEKRFPFDGAEIKGVFSLAKFSENFDVENNTISNPENDKIIKDIVRKIQSDL